MKFICLFAIALLAGSPAIAQSVEEQLQRQYEQALERGDTEKAAELEQMLGASASVKVNTTAPVVPATAPVATEVSSFSEAEAIAACSSKLTREWERDRKDWTYSQAPEQKTYRSETDYRGITSHVLEYEAYWQDRINDEFKDFSDEYKDRFNVWPQTVEGHQYYECKAVESANNSLDVDVRDIDAIAGADFGTRDPNLGVTPN